MPAFAFSSFVSIRWIYDIKQFAQVFTVNLCKDQVRVALGPICFGALFVLELTLMPTHRFSHLAVSLAVWATTKRTN